MMFTYELAPLMKPRNVTVNCLDPGTVNTKMLIAGLSSSYSVTAYYHNHYRDKVNQIQVPARYVYMGAISCLLAVLLRIVFSIIEHCC